MLGTRTVASALAITAVAGLGLELATRAGGAADDRYSIECRLVVVTDESSLPEPLFGRTDPRDSTRDGTTFAAVGYVTNGTVGSTQLLGMRFALFGKGKWAFDRPLEALSVYIDDSAPPEKLRALGTVLLRDPALRSKTSASLTTTPISALWSPDPLASRKLRVGLDGRLGVLEITPMKGADGRNPLAVRNGFSRFAEREPVSLAVGRARFSDQGRKLDVVNGAGEIHYIRLAGSFVPPIIEEAPPEGAHGGP
jgi:hypothetical protein